MHNFDNISSDIFVMRQEMDYDILEMWSVHQDLKLFLFTENMPLQEGYLLIARVTISCGDVNNSVCNICALSPVIKLLWSRTYLQKYIEAVSS